MCIGSKYILIIRNILSYNYPLDSSHQFYTLFPEYKCNCSRNYIEGVLAALGEKELRETVAEQGKIEVHCHYCNTDYVFTPQDVEEIIRRGKSK